MKITLKRDKGTGIVKKDGKNVTMEIVSALSMSHKSIGMANSTIKEVASHYDIYHTTTYSDGKTSCERDYSPHHIDLTQGQLIDLRDAVKIAKRNIEQLEGLINTTIYLSGVTIIEGDDPIEAESKETD